MKKVLLTALGALLFHVTSFGCEVCKKQQPKILREISHGAGPVDNWDYVIVSVTAILVLTILYFTVKCLVKPGEQSASHIKRLFID